MKKLTFPLVIAIVLLSGLAFAEAPNEKASQEKAPACCLTDEAGHVSCTLTSGGEGAAEKLLQEVVQEKSKANQYASLQADIDRLLEIIDFE